MTKHTKKMVEHNIEVLDCYCTVAQARSILKDLPGDAFLNTDEDILIMHKREETDEEYTKRLKRYEEIRTQDLEVVKTKISIWNLNPQERKDLKHFIDKLK